VIALAAVPQRLSVIAHHDDDRPLQQRLPCERVDEPPDL
jgi:hypothetical protein